MQGIGCKICYKWHSPWTQKTQIGHGDRCIATSCREDRLTHFHYLKNTAVKGRAGSLHLFPRMSNIMWAAAKDFRLENLGQSLKRKSLGKGMKAVIPKKSSCKWGEGELCPRVLAFQLPARCANWWVYRLTILWTQAHKLLSLSRVSRVLACISTGNRIQLLWATASENKESDMHGQCPSSHKLGHLLHCL